MIRLAACSALVLGVLIVSCSSSEPVADEPKTDTPKTSTPTVDGKSTSTQKPSAKSEVIIGMEAADVKTLMGAPDDSKHEHGPGGAELDIWIYKDGKITFTNGKVSKIE